MTALYRISILTASGVLVLGTPFRSPGAEPLPPRLAVVISLDQFRQDYLSRFEPYFVDAGFRLLLEEGANFENCNYRHAVTKTAVGHATISTGAHPMVHGIIENTWMRGYPPTRKPSVEDETSPLVGTGHDAAADRPDRSGRSPRQLLASTVGDQLKMRWGESARVFGMAGKDRSAILMAGRMADGAFWEENGRMVSSRYYYDRLPAWAQGFNDAGPAETVRGRTWDRLLDASVYDAVQGTDDAEGEYDGGGLGRVFPHAIGGERFHEAFSNSPFASEMLAEFARIVVKEERLGQDDVPDLLCIGFSQIDIMGHNYGPDSHEMMDSVLRLDRVLADFFIFLENQVGLANCIIVLTADHGAAPLPERLQSVREDFPTGRVDMRAIDQGMAAALDAAFGSSTGARWFQRDGDGYRIGKEALESNQRPLETVARVMKDYLNTRPEIAVAFTRREMLGMPATGDGIAAMLRRSFHATRSPDVVFTFAPYFFNRAGTGTTHGTPHAYDTHVPLLWWGPGVAPGRFTEPVGVEDLAPTLAALLRLPRPPGAAGRMLF